MAHARGNRRENLVAAFASQGLTFNPEALAAFNSRPLKDLGAPGGTGVPVTAGVGGVVTPPGVLPLAQETVADRLVSVERIRLRATAAGIGGEESRSLLRKEITPNGAPRAGISAMQKAAMAAGRKRRFQ